VLGLCAVAVLGTAGAATAGVGSVSGTVTLAVPAPARAPLPVFKNHEVCGQNVPDDGLVVGPGGGVRYAVVSVEGVRGGKKPERDTTLVLDNEGCRFVPHVQVAEVGQWLELRNLDAVLHNADARLGAETLRGRRAGARRAGRRRALSPVTRRPAGTRTTGRSRASRR
jgi:hypothetical protein